MFGGVPRSLAEAEAIRAEILEKVSNEVTISGTAPQEVIEKIVDTALGVLTGNMSYMVMELQDNGWVVKDPYNPEP